MTASPTWPPCGPGGSEAWVAIRGERHVHVLRLDRDDLFDPARPRMDRLETTALIDVANGPSMVSFTSDGRWAFVAAGKEAQLTKLDADRREVVDARPVPAAFTPFGLVAPDDQEVYLVHIVVGP